MSNDKGIATIESVLLLSIFVVFFTYYMGFFGVVHTGILNSISARAYTFETFRNRTNLIYFRDTPAPELLQTSTMGFRAHGVISEKASGLQDWYATDRSIAQGRDLEFTREANFDPVRIEKRESRKANPVLIKTAYGICLNAKCEG